MYYILNKPVIRKLLLILILLLIVDQLPFDTFKHSYAQISSASCAIRLNSSSSSVTLGYTNLVLSAQVLQLLITSGSIDRVEFVSSNTAIASVLTPRDLTAPYQTLVRGNRLGNFTVTARVVMGGTVRCIASKNLTVAAPSQLPPGTPVPTPTPVAIRRPTPTPLPSIQEIVNCNVSIMPPVNPLGIGETGIYRVTVNNITPPNYVNSLTFDSSNNIFSINPSSFNIPRGNSSSFDFQVTANNYGSSRLTALAIRPNGAVGCSKAVNTATQGYTIAGSIFIDLNKNKIKDVTEVNYIGNYDISSSNGMLDINTATGIYTIENALTDVITSVSLTSLPAGYQMTYPLNGPPPSFSVKVGPGCVTNVTSGASCDVLGNITNLNFAITDSIPWIQSRGMDMRFDNGITNYVAGNPTCTGPYASVPGSSSTAGIIFTGDRTPVFGKGSSSVDGWIVGGSSYPELYKSSASRLPSSYISILANLNKSGTAITNLSTVCDPANCTLPNNLRTGAYQATGNVRLNGYNFKNNENYVFLINGSLTILGDLRIPNGSTALFTASGDIIIDRNVGSNPSCNASANLQGFYSADRNVTVQGINDCTIGADRMLSFEGTLFVNAEIAGGVFDNQRDLCGDNYNYPSITFVERADFILNAPNLLKRKSFIFQEEAP